MKMVQHMKENGKILKDKIMEFFIIIILIDMKANLNIICMKEKVNYFYLIEIFVMKDFGEMGKNSENLIFIMNWMNLLRKKIMIMILNYNELFDFY